jgi:multiple sugar transport system ATP-binding protein
MAGLSIENLTKSYHGTAVVDDVSFAVAPGEFCILLGPSGCGKSTILRLIAGLEEQEGGKILIGDRDIGALNPRDRDVAMVFQSYALYPHLNVYENIAFPLRVRKTPAGEVDHRVR